MCKRIKKESIIKLINDAFKNVEPPKADQIANPNDWEFESITDNFSKMLVTKPSFKLIEWHHDSLPALKPQAFHYFIKYYLIFALKYSDSDTEENVVYHLSSVDPKSKFWSKRLTLFSHEQKKSICLFLKYTQSGEEYEFYNQELIDAMSYWCL